MKALNLKAVQIFVIVVEWNAVTPMVFGTDVRLVCNISCCSRNQGTAQASWDILRDKISINVAANSHSRDISKYEVLVGENRCSLVIKNFSQTDVNISYTCTSNFKSYTKVLEINEDEFERKYTHNMTNRVDYDLHVHNLFKETNIILFVFPLIPFV